MESLYSATQIFSLGNYVQRYLEGDIVLEPYCYLIIWLTEDDSAIEGENIFCLYQSNYTALQDLKGKDGYVLSFPVYYFDNFRGTSFQDFFDNLFQVRTFKVANDCRGILEILRQEIVRELNGRVPNPLKDEILKSLLKIFMIRLSYESGGSFPVGERAGDVQFATRFFDLIRMHFVEKKRVSDYSEMMNMNSNYLNFRIKQLTGFSASYHIGQRVAVEAKRLALQNKLLVKEVAYALGYTDIAHFSKWFKNRIGVNFTDYQRQHGHWAKGDHM